MLKLKRTIIALTVASALLIGVTVVLRMVGFFMPQSLSQLDATRQPPSADLAVVSPIPSSLALQTLPFAPAPKLIELDSPDSSHPVERAVALGTILDSKIEKTGVANQWIRTRLAKTKVQPRLVRVVDLLNVEATTQSATVLSREMFLADQVILKAALGVNEENLRRGLAALEISLVKPISDGVFSARSAQDTLDAMPQALSLLAQHPELVESVEPDGVGFSSGRPNDTRFSEQWSLHNTGQLGGMVDADVDAPEFWDIIDSTPGIVIAVLDTGLNLTHPDLRNIAWVNPREVRGDGKDNDANGKIDDVNGWDFANNDNNPTDDDGHGSHVSGIIAANRNNSSGIAGMLSGASILACKVLNDNGSGLTSDLVAAMTYARQRRVPMMNLSLQSYPLSDSLNTEITACRTADILLIISAGNQGVNNDITPNYPSSYTQSNIIAVGNHDRTGVRSSSSNFGLVSVDLFAPGQDILSTVLGTAYESNTGTSQAAPHVTAICAALKSVNPSWTAVNIKESVLSSVITNGNLRSVSVTGGRLNSVNALGHSFRKEPLKDNDGDGFSNFFEYLSGTRIDSVSGLPALFTETGDGYLRHGVQRVLRSDGKLEVETSADLETWTTAGVVDFSTPSNLLRGISISAQPRAFMRIKAVAVP